MRRGWSSWLFDPVDIASLVAFRVMFGAIMLWEVYRFFSHGWIERYYIEPTFFFTYHGFSWVHPWPGVGMYLHFIVMGVLAVCLIAGLFYRACAVLFFLAFTYVFLLDETNYLNHFYFVSLMSFLLIVLPAHRAASLDAWRMPAIRSDDVPAWSLWLIRAQVGVLYIGAGVAKLNADYLSGEPLRTWLADRRHYTLLGGSIPIGRMFTEEWVVWIFTAGGVLFDLLVVPALICKRTRLLAFGFALVFHLTNAMLFDIGIFPWFSIAATLMFFEPDWPRRIFNWPRRDSRLAYVPAGFSSTPLGMRLVRGFIVFFLAYHIFMPLRHLLYPGSVHWTEEGHRFAWHMKLRDKWARGDFEARDPATGRTWHIDPRDYLTSKQVLKMLKWPDMILQFAHHVADDLRKRGVANPEIRARIRVSLNGREPQLFIDPDVNLAAEKRSLRPAPWILPLQTPLPRPKRPG